MLIYGVICIAVKGANGEGISILGSGIFGAGMFKSLGKELENVCSLFRPPMFITSFPKMPTLRPPPLI